MNSSEKKTVDLDRLALIQGLLERQETKMDNVSSKVDLLDTRFRSLESTTEGVRTEVQRLNTRMTEAEKDIRELRDKDASILRTASSADMEHEAAIGGAMIHVQKLETAIQEMRAEQAAPIRKITRENMLGVVLAGLGLLIAVAKIVAHLLGVDLGGTP